MHYADTPVVRLRGLRSVTLGVPDPVTSKDFYNEVWGLGLTEAVRTALAEAKLGLHEIDCRFSDVTGELYGFKELPLVEGRLMRVVRKREQPLWHWAEVIGDSGAAAGALQLVAADEAFRKGYAPGERIICLTSAGPGDRASAVLRRSAR